MCSFIIVFCSVPSVPYFSIGPTELSIVQFCQNVHSFSGLLLSVIVTWNGTGPSKP